MRRKQTSFRLSQPSQKLLVGFYDAVLLALCLEAVLFCCVSVYHFSVHTTFLAWFVAGLGVLFAALWTLRVYRITLLLIETVWIVCIWHFWEELCFGEVALRCSIVNTIASKIETVSRIQPVADLPDAVWTNYATLWIAAAGLILAGLIGWFLCRSRRALPVILLSALPLIPALCVTEAPDPMPAAVLLTVWGTVALRSLTDRRDPDGGAMMTPQALTASALVLVLLMQILPVEGYTQPLWASQLREDIINGASRFDLSSWTGDLFHWRGAGSTKYVSLTGGAGGYTGRTALRVHTDVPGKHYLRGWSADVYTGRRWEPFSEEDQRTLDGIVADMETPPLLARGQLLRKAENETNFMEVENVSAPGSCVYFPYGMTETPEGAELAESHLGRKGREWKNTVHFLPVTVPPSPLSGMAAMVSSLYHPVERVSDCIERWYWEGGIMLGDEVQFAQAETEPYRNFVWEHYLEVPEGLEEELSPWLESVEFGAHLESIREIEEFLRLHTWGRLFPYYSGGQGECPGWRAIYIGFVTDYVIDALAMTTTYDRDAPAAPAGEEYVGWFLNERKTGYCMHYATAATLLLRMMHVPARYVSGYVVDVPETGYAVVPDEFAHAWVEIYLDGLGWYPVEVTPGFEGDGMGTDGGDSAETMATAVPTPTPTPTATPAASDAVAPSVPPSQKPSGTADEDSTSGSWMWILAAVCVILAAVLWVILGKNRREKRLQGPDTNAAVLYALAYSRRLEKWGQQPVDETLEKLGEKAKFSQHTLTEHERDTALERLHQRKENALRDLPWWRRWIIRLIV